MTEQRDRQRLLLKIEAVAETLSISRSKVWELISRGDLRVVRIDRSTRVLREECERYVASLSAQAKDEMP